MISTHKRVETNRSQLANMLRAVGLNSLSSSSLSDSSRLRVAFDGAPPRASAWRPHPTVAPIPRPTLPRARAPVFLGRYGRRCLRGHASHGKHARKRFGLRRPAPYTPGRVESGSRGRARSSTAPPVPQSRGWLHAAGGGPATACNAPRGCWRP